MIFFKGEEDAIPVIIGKGQKTRTPITISMHRVLVSKKCEKLVVEKTEFDVDSATFDNQLMINIFSGKLAVFRDEAMLFIEAARVGKTKLLESMLDTNPGKVKSSVREVLSTYSTASNCDVAASNKRVGYYIKNTFY